MNQYRVHYAHRVGDWRMFGAASHRGTMIVVADDESAARDVCLNRIYAAHSDACHVYAHAVLIEESAS